MASSTKYTDWEDPALVKAAQDGDLCAFEELVVRHRDKIYARAFSLMRNETDASDMAQQAWVKAWQRLHLFHGDANFTTWMTRITINLCLDELRRLKRRQFDSMDAENGSGESSVKREFPAITHHPISRMERKELRGRIDEALAKLSEVHRTAIVLHEFEGMEYKRIAELMGCSIGTVMSRLFYARKRMATMLADLKSESKP